MEENNDIQKQKQDFIEKSKEYAEQNGFQLNPDEKIVERIVNGIFMNEEKHGAKYCPCRRITGDKEEDAKKICPCFWHKDEIAKDGRCFCGLFIKK